MENIGLEVDLGRIFAPSWGQKWTQNRCKRVLEKCFKNNDAQDEKKHQKSPQHKPVLTKEREARECGELVMKLIR